MTTRRFKLYTQPYVEVLLQKLEHVKTKEEVLLLGELLAETSFQLGDFSRLISAWVNCCHRTGHLAQNECAVLSSLLETRLNTMTHTKRVNLGEIIKRALRQYDDMVQSGETLQSHEDEFPGNGHA